MTRLIEDWIKDIPDTIKQAENELIAKTGLDFTALAAAAWGLDAAAIVKATEVNRAAVIPVTAGQGIIGSFVQAVAAVVGHLGFHAFITEKTDVAGIYEAHQRGANLVFIADDECFLAINTAENRVSENSIGTARGYVAALEGAVGSLENKKVLVLGCGRVGRAALLALRDKGAIGYGYDTNKETAGQMSQEGWPMITDPADIKDFTLIFDANPEEGWLTRDMLHPQAWVAAPGVPLSLDEEAAKAYKPRLIHDYLPIGIAAMLGQVI